MDISESSSAGSEVMIVDSGKLRVQNLGALNREWSGTTSAAIYKCKLPQYFLPTYCGIQGFEAPNKKGRKLSEELIENVSVDPWFSITLQKLKPDGFKAPKARPLNLIAIPIARAIKQYFMISTHC